jgi:DNA-binding IclR family transcriptional regulator
MHALRRSRPLDFTTLEQCGFVTAAGEPQEFRLGPAVAQLAHAWGASHDLGAIAQLPA